MLIDLIHRNSQEHGEKRARSEQQLRDIKARLAIVEDDLQKTRTDFQSLLLELLFSVSVSKL